MNNRTITLSIDGRSLAAPAGATIWEAARSAGIDIPTLCHDPKLEPVAVCRVCVVDVENARTLPAACIRKVEEGMAVRTDTDRVRRARRTLVELLEAGQPHADEEADQADREGRVNQADQADQAGQAGQTGRRKPAEQDELWRLGRQLRSDPSRFAATCSNPTKPPDLSSPVIAVDLNACILCDRCIRACDDVQVNDVIGRTGKGCETGIAFDNGLPLGGSSCVSCGECVATCPTGALTDKRLVDAAENGSDAAVSGPDSSANGPDALEADPDTVLDGSGKRRIGTDADGGATSRVDSICPYCGVGCGISYHVRNGRIEGVTGRDDTHTEGRLCVKGRYGYDYAHHPQRLTKPLVRREDVLSETAAVRGLQGLPGLPPLAPLAGVERPHTGGVPRGRMGRGAGPGGAPAAGDQEHAWSRARWRVSDSAKVTNEEAFLFPEADPGGLRHQQRRPLHAPLPRLVRGGPHRGDRQWGGLQRLPGSP